MAIQIYTVRGCFHVTHYNRQQLPYIMERPALIIHHQRIYHLGTDEDYALHAEMVCLGIPHAFEKITPREWCPMFTSTGEALLIVQEPHQYFATTFVPDKMLTRFNHLDQIYELYVNSW